MFLAITHQLTLYYVVMVTFFFLVFPIGEASQKNNTQKF
jgi:hypothetical protein